MNDRRLLTLLAALLTAGVAGCTLHIIPDPPPPAHPHRPLERPAAPMPHRGHDMDDDSDSDADSDSDSDTDSDTDSD